MRFEKQITVDTPRQVVWDFLWDVPRLVACVPGCDGAEEIEPQKRYQATVKEKVGPFRITVPLAIEVVEHIAPQRVVARASGKDTIVQSHVKVELDVTLVEIGEQTTEVQMGAEVAVLGKLGTLGHSVIVRKGNEIIAQFAHALQAALHKEVD